jgi:transposase
LAAALFSLLATLKLWQINPRLWLHWYLQSCAEAGGQAPKDIEPFLPWNLPKEMRAKLSLTAPEQKSDTS